MAERKRRAFIIMPFADEYVPVYEVVITPPLVEAGYEVERADDLAGRDQSILRRIVQAIAESDLVVADLTDLNPNVLYELGLAHGLQRPAVLLTQDIAQVPFDLRTYQVESYSWDHRDVVRIHGRLKAIAEQHAAGSMLFANPVTEFAADNLEAPKGDAGPLSGPQSAVEDEADRGMLDFLVDGLEDMESITGLMQDVGREMQGLASKAETRADEISQLNALALPGTAKQVRQLVADFATETSAGADRMDAILSKLHDSVDRLADNLPGFLAHAVLRDEDDLQAAQAFRAQMAALIESTEPARDATTGFRNVAHGMANISAPMTRASRRLVRSLDGLISVTDKVQALCSKALTVMDGKLAEAARDVSG